MPDPLGNINMETLKEAYETGKAYIEQKRFDLAIAEFKKVIEAEGNNEQAHFELGKVYYLQKEFSLAISAFQKTLSLNPDNHYAHLLLAKSYQNNGAYDLAKEEFKKVSESPAADYDTHVELSELFKSAKMYNLAVEEYEKLLTYGSDHNRFADLLQLYNFEGDYTKVKELVPRLLENSSYSDIFWKNMLLNELEIAEQKTILESKPRILLVTLSNRCNLNCPMCGKGDSIWEISQDMMEQIVALFPYLELLTWQGGEVFLVERFKQLLEKTFGFSYLRQIIITNALLITEEWADRLASRHNVGLTISIDSVDSKIYEQIRRGGSFERLTQNLRLLNRAKKKHSSNMTLSLRATVMKSNYAQLERFIEFAREYEFDIVQMAPLSSDGYDPQNIFINNDLEILRYISQTVPKIRELAQRYRIKLLDWIPSLPETDNQAERIMTVPGEDKPVESKKPVCFRPWKQLAMNVKGDIFPECLCAEPVGKASVDSLAGVWNNQKMQDYRRKLSGHNFTDWCRPECVQATIPAEHLKFTFV